ncbi:MAG: arsenical pump-driving ATPase [Nitrospirota bacterium]
MLLTALLGERPTRYLFFTGKGGVGKTSLACATAVALADGGRRVVLISTDPASNLTEVLGVAVGSAPTPVPGVVGLAACNIDPQAAAQQYRERAVAPYRGVLPESAIASMEEQLSGACTVEVAAFDELIGWLADPGRGVEVDHVVFDTAPTGHTLRLLALPAAWSGFLATNTTGVSCLGPTAALESGRDRYRQAVDTLTDAGRTTVVLVTRPEATAVEEAARAAGELRRLGLASQRLAVNGRFRATDPGDPIAAAFERRDSGALARLPEPLEELPRADLPLQPHNLLGIDALRGMVGDAPVAAAAATPSAVVDLPSLAPLVADLAAAGRGLILLMGKGGVGKTTLAAALAVTLAERGHAVHLSTTDPAAHVAGTVADGVAGLTISRIDPAAETRAYTAEVLATAGRDLDAAGRRLLEEDLRSPCTEEVAVFHAFARLVAEAQDRLVIVDTAPTGHTLLLLDTTGAYHREVVRKGGGELATPLARLRDPDYTRLLLVTLPETTPVAEAEVLAADLRRAEMVPYAWVVNGSLAAAHPRDPLLAARAAAERTPLARVFEIAPRVAVVPWQAEPLVGAAPLAALCRSARFGSLPPEAGGKGA